MNDQERAIDLSKRLAAIGRGDVNMSAHDAWVLLAGLQLAWRHPSIGEPLRVHMREVGQRLQRIFAPDQLVFDLASMGWVEQLDMPRKPEEPDLEEEQREQMEPLRCAVCGRLILEVAAVRVWSNAAPEAMWRVHLACAGGLPGPFIRRR